MTNHKNRIAKLEEKSQQHGKRMLIVYEHEQTPESLEALQRDETIGTLIIVRFADADHNEPQSEIRYGNGNVKRVGIDMGKI